MEPCPCGTQGTRREPGDLRISSPPPDSLFRRQLLDAAGIETRERIFDRDSFDLPIRRNLGKRHQNEGPFEQARMRQGQTAFVHFEAVECDDVDIENARPPALFPCPVAAKYRLDAKGTIEESAGRQRGVDDEGQIDEWRLIGHAPWRSPVI